ncbi:hypothetical protein GGTG_03649 [Gaeumannomyces tritici R3-111a-1]|uniref:Uncharacterized protein n=1 Tax=Gaeumannomyces tritici (strain R3-111a-1) TaxID=644352 RepID=J3NQU3_GAET3|nr:hypothetical protein GGTG_03649 [Gaeumannomyces tritici R3-111a-1]EJT78549.1 hypothetical protein GGTG_03649 [Gaeumannomyces tritici R3-111a-1]
MTEAAEALSEIWPSIRWLDKVKNKYHGLKQAYRDWLDFGQRSGVTVDPLTGVYQASEAAW